MQKMFFIISLLSLSIFGFELDAPLRGGVSGGGRSYYHLKGVNTARGNFSEVATQAYAAAQRLQGTKLSELGSAKSSSVKIDSQITQTFKRLEVGNLLTTRIVVPKETTLDKIGRNAREIAIDSWYSKMNDSIPCLNQPYGDRLRGIIQKKLEKQEPQCRNVIGVDFNTTCYKSKKTPNTYVCETDTWLSPIESGYKQASNILAQNISPSFVSCINNHPLIKDSSYIQEKYPSFAFHAALAHLTGAPLYKEISLMRNVPENAVVLMTMRGAFNKCVKQEDFLAEQRKLLTNSASVNGISMASLQRAMKVHSDHNTWNGMRMLAK